MIVKKAVRMAGMMKKSVIALVENMSYFVCPDCGKTHEIFGKSRVEAIAAEYGVPCTARIPFDADLAGCSDDGEIELFDGNWLDELADKIEQL